jgi:pimeloyl-ACP methyl ester carboxylesterase
LVPCVGLPKLPTARCGSVAVPWDRADPGAGTTRVAFAVLPRRDRSRPSLGTIAVNPGGPGGSVIDGAGEQYAEAFKPLLGRRELLLMDPRGVGRSGQLRCRALADPTWLLESRKQQLARTGRCGRELGPKVGYYGSAAVADDLDQIRASLGVAKLDLQGDSYGTYLMPVYAERHPDHVRSVVLSGAYPVNYDPLFRDNAGAVRRGIALVCARTKKCTAATVLGDLTALATRLRTRPETATVTYGGKTYPVAVDERQLATAVYQAYSSGSLPAELGVVRAAAAARRGDLAAVTSLITDSLRDVVTLVASDLRAGNNVFASFLATSCHDYPRVFDYADDVATRKRDFDAALAGVDPAAFAPFSAQAWSSRLGDSSDNCLAWPAVPGAKAPFLPGAPLPDVPVLVLSGDLDANTPSQSGRQAAAQFPRARFVEIRDSGHTPTGSPAGLKLILDFFRDRR